MVHVQSDVVANLCHAGTGSIAPMALACGVLFAKPSLTTSKPNPQPCLGRFTWFVELPLVKVVSETAQRLPGHMLKLDYGIDGLQMVSVAWQWFPAALG